MKHWFHVCYLTVWFRVHPITGPVAGEDPTPVIYPTWRQSFALARYVAR